MRQEGQIKATCLCVCQCGYVFVCVSLSVCLGVRVASCVQRPLLCAAVIAAAVGRRPGWPLCT